MSAQSGSFGTPLSRDWINDSRRHLRIGLGVLFMAWSWVSTIIKVAWLLQPVLGTGAAMQAVGLLIGALWAVVVSWVEFSTSDTNNIAYWGVLLLFDAPFTAWTTGDAFMIILAARATINAQLVLMCWIAALVLGILAARYGEILLFGQPGAKTRRFARSSAQ